MERRDLAEGIFTISGVLTADECRQMIALADRRGWELATINAFGIARVDKDTRNNDRAIVDDVDLASRLWSRVQAFIPLMQNDRPAVGLNERLRFYRYTPGQRFDWHFDGSYARDNGEASQLTFMIYLNKGYKGGQTRFESVSVAGKLGMALVFEHELLHEGAEVTAGVKYVLRSDVMYGPWAKRAAEKAGAT
ncbi:MAG TPA: 2OG-Fe(II) oxygenase [Steroidobacter sp.]|uniref:prolyl hydroxylase family protein n=1 Tax=Steroidobacter sp. TaxID=1978227 RepID=UPI002EDA4043